MSSVSLPLVTLDQAATSTPADAHLSGTAPVMVSGWRQRLARLGLWLRVARLALGLLPLTRVPAVLRALYAERRQRHLGVQRKYARFGGRWYWDLHGPAWPSPAFDGFVRRELRRAASPTAATAGLQTALVAITKRCPLRCAHCCEWLALNQREALTRADLVALVTRLQDFGVAQIMLSGGEPLQRFDDLCHVLASARPETDFWVLSSGVGLTLERARRLRQAGLRGIALSLDHYDAAAHDAFRGRPGAFAAVVAAAAAARAADLTLAVTLCPTRAFVSSTALERYAELARTLGAGFVQVLEPKAVGHFAGQDVALDAAQQATLEAFCLRLNHDPAAAHLPLVSYPDLARRRLGCQGAGQRYLYVDTDGQLHACPFCRAPAGRVLAGGPQDFEQLLGALRARGCPLPAAPEDAGCCGSRSTLRAPGGCASASRGCDVQVSGLQDR
jgi:MoaA/NifB/PqqE/SkfB family radical SAM enzyme